MKKILNICAIVSSLFLIAVPAHATTDHTNYFSFEEGTGRSVGDTGGQNGAMYGTSQGFGWASGKVGTALGMDATANTGVALPNSALSGSQGTISAWFKMNELADGNVIFSGKSTTDNNIFVALSIDYQGRPQLLFRTDPSGVNRKVQIGAVLNKNEWYHLVLVASGSHYRAFVNGEEKIISGENIGRWFPDFTNQVLSYRIGASEANPLVGSWNGYLDEMRIYNRVLSPEEATRLYGEGNNGTPTVPLALRPKLNFTVSSERVEKPGTVTLTWSTELVESCTAGGHWSESIATSGSAVKTNITSDQVYTMVCQGKGGVTDAVVRVSVATGVTKPEGGSSLTMTQEFPVTNKPTKAVSAQFMRDLKLGDNGDDVKSLQELLIQKNVLAAGLTSGYFGELTKSALSQYQGKIGLPATGYFGLMTRAKLGTVENSGNSMKATEGSVTPPVSGDKSAQIAQLLTLIAELQKQLAALKATTY